LGGWRTLLELPQKPWRELGSPVPPEAYERIFKQGFDIFDGNRSSISRPMAYSQPDLSTKIRTS
jgi:hypothetical protein